MVHSKSSKALRPDVTLTFPQLSLHSAAATGNVGLVKYALINGQPQNSSLHGVLPIHAACSNGNEAIVRMLLENGADPNAPRLPRRYSNDKRPSSAPSVGTSGSTPLHFAAANGHAGIVKLLLSCGARPDLTEKRGLTPEDVANQSGHPDVAQILRNWDRSVAASTLPVMDGPGRRHSLDVRSLPPPDLGHDDRLASAHPSLAKKGSSASLRASRRHASSHASQTVRPVYTEPMTYSSLTHLPNASSNSLTDGKRGLPAVLEKAAHPRSTIKHALGLPQSGPPSSSRPPPLELAESTQDSFAKPALARKGSTSSTRSALKGLFGRKRRSSSSSMISSPFSPTVLTPMEPPPSLTIDDMPSTSAVTSATTSPELEGGPSGSSSPSLPQFPTIDLPPPIIAKSPPTSRPQSPHNYRPRKSSILSTTDAITVREEDEPRPADLSPALSGTSSTHLTESSLEEQSEAQDRIPEIGHYRSPSGSRLRANSAESGSSTGSRLSNFSPHGLPMHSPLGSFSGESTPSLLEVGTRARRSASTTTEPDLRHLVLSGHRDGSQTDVSPGSPVSSSWSQRGFPMAPSATSTPATSINYSSASGPVHRKLSPQDVTPHMADELVKQAESRLLSFNSDRSASKPSLSEQLAAYSDTLNLQREVKRREKARKSYTWEKLDKDGHRTPIPPSEGLPAAGSKAGRASRPSAFQQGVLDVRRDPPPKLRQEAKVLRECKSHSSLSGSSRVEMPRLSGSSARHPTSSLQYRILESNHLNVPAPPSGGRLSPGSSSIDDPVRRVSSSSASSSSSVVEAPRSTRSAVKRESQPVESAATPELVTPIASWGVPDTPFGIEGLGSSDGRPKGRLAKGFGALKSKLL